MLATARLILGLFGVLILLGGLLTLGAGGLGLLGVVTTISGALILLALLYERSRYRSVPADAANEPSGPGGGEPGGIAPAGFRPTSEVFVDPSSGQRMRVYSQAASGARRYVAEGKSEAKADGGDHA
ncbi:MAG TPA: hypothetical protein VIB99_06805 [Candidatus Limnocylindrales bacterium]|jgi:hypothetical protein